jgi:hypothetical protein
LWDRRGPGEGSRFLLPGQPLSEPLCCSENESQRKLPETTPPSCAQEVELAWGAEPGPPYILRSTVSLPCLWGDIVCLWGGTQLSKESLCPGHPALALTHAQGATYLLAQCFLCTGTTDRPASLSTSTDREPGQSRLV